MENQANAPKVSEDFRLALIDLDPRQKLMELYIIGLTVASFQGSSDIRNRASSALGVSNEQIPKSRFIALDPFFTARNDVAHRLDLLEPETVDARPSRRPRSDGEVKEMCDQALLLVRDLIRAAANNIVGCK